MGFHPVLSMVITGHVPADSTTCRRHPLPERAVRVQKLDVEGPTRGTRRYGVATRPAPVPSDSSQQPLGCRPGLLATGPTAHPSSGTRRTFVPALTGPIRGCEMPAEGCSASLVYRFALENVTGRVVTQRIGLHRVVRDGAVGCLIGTDVDAPTGQTGSESCVLPLLADGQ